MIDEKLTTKHRNALAASSFALPKMRKLPIPDISHARNALARASMMLNEHDITRAQYDAALLRIYAKYPSLKTHDSVWFDADNHGWRVGQRAEYPYRFWGSDGHPWASGTVTAVTSTGVHIRPDPAFAYGEGTVARTFAKVRHTSRKKATGKPGSYPH